MKEKTIYIGAFVIAFIFVSSAIIYVNTLFRNIFKFDFSPVGQVTYSSQQQQTMPAAAQNPPAQTDQQKTDSMKVAALLSDSLKNQQPVKLDTASTVALKDTNAIKKVQNVVNTQKTMNEAEAINNPVAKTSTTKPDTTYSKWIKKTGKLYESMDAKKAAKIILGYSDNIARDLLLSMRKKKAAEILSEIKPEIASRIISLN